ncbi:MAG: T9SS type A sorting domain-containing protein, partial [Saprospiraceae bacterium]
GNQLQLDNVSFSDAGSYYARITNPDLPQVQLFSQHVQVNVLEAGALSISKVNLKGSLTEDYNLLQWQDDSSDRLKKYSLEVLQDNQLNWQQITEMVANGKDENFQSYSYKHYSLKPVTFYRLASTDADGSVRYSNTIKIERMDEKFITIYPNPAHDFIKINSFTKEVSDFDYRIMNLTGQQVAEGKSTTGAILKIDHLPTGLYQIEIRFGKRIAIEQFSIQN